MLRNALAGIIVATELFRPAYAMFVEDDLVELTKISDEVATTFYSRKLEEDGKGKGDCPCCKCIMGGTKFIMGMTMKKVGEACKKTNGGKGPLKEFCGLLRKKPFVAGGMLFEKVRPIGTAFGYCYGHGECKKHDMTLKDQMPE